MIYERVVGVSPNLIEWGTPQPSRKVERDVYIILPAYLLSSQREIYEIILILPN